MKLEQIKQITSKAIEELVAALNSGRSKALTNYLAAMGRFHRRSFGSKALRWNIRRISHPRRVSRKAGRLGCFQASPRLKPWRRWHMS